MKQVFVEQIIKMPSKVRKSPGNCFHSIVKKNYQKKTMLDKSISTLHQRPSRVRGTTSNEKNGHLITVIIYLKRTIIIVSIFMGVVVVAVFHLDRLESLSGCEMVPKWKNAIHLRDDAIEIGFHMRIGVKIVSSFCLWRYTQEAHAFT